MNKLINKLFSFIRLINKRQVSEIIVETDISNVFQSIQHSKELHKKLIILCHPDRFIDQNKKNIAEEISKEINNNRFNYKELLKLELKMNQELLNN
jgi:hypothetical protein